MSQQKTTTSKQKKKNNTQPPLVNQTQDTSTVTQNEENGVKTKGESKVKSLKFNFLLQTRGQRCLIRKTKEFQDPTNPGSIIEFEGVIDLFPSNGSELRLADITKYLVSPDNRRVELDKIEYGHFRMSEIAEVLFEGINIQRAGVVKAERPILNIVNQQKDEVINKDQTDNQKQEGKNKVTTASALQSSNVQQREVKYNENIWQDLEIDTKITQKLQKGNKKKQNSQQYQQQQYQQKQSGVSKQNGTIEEKNLNNQFQSQNQQQPQQLQQNFKKEKQQQKFQQKLSQQNQSEKQKHPQSQNSSILSNQQTQQNNKDNVITQAGQPRELERYIDKETSQKINHEAVNDSKVDWSALNQFELNQKMFNTKSTYDFEKYTSKLDEKKLTEEQKQKAKTISLDIERDELVNEAKQAQIRAELIGDQDDEEYQHSSVIKVNEKRLQVNQYFGNQNQTQNHQSQPQQKKQKTKNNKQKATGSNHNEQNNNKKQQNVVTINEKQVKLITKQQDDEIEQQKLRDALREAIGAQNNSLSQMNQFQQQIAALGVNQTGPIDSRSRTGSLLNSVSMNVVGNLNLDPREVEYDAHQQILMYKIEKKKEEMTRNRKSSETFRFESQRLDERIKQNLQSPETRRENDKKAMQHQKQIQKPHFLFKSVNIDKLQKFNAYHSLEKKQPLENVACLIEDWAVDAKDQSRQLIVE
ncbi:UNKNOWN [Stylonychia lemnae]|uniref:LsmAD domain-containing protein n=1 Tax=Stylonychia lemnae TaxID=5949 RepID=A0A077ZZ53_STYLE|nr:UNKNOWN [Stylonychia lemnae]|eukprot:CDW74852.1 UNKNOWN [Stylonychia lemnae]